MCECRGPYRPEEDSKSLGAGVTVNSCELPNMAAGGQSWVLWRGNASFTCRASLQPHYFCKSKNILLPVCGRIIRKEVVIEIVKKKVTVQQTNRVEPGLGSS